MDLNSNQVQQLLINMSENTTNQTFISNSQTQFIDVFMIILTLTKIINIILMTINYGLLIFQTIYILKPKQPKCINLRNVAVKWIICIIVYQIKQGFVQKYDIPNQIYVILMDLIILFFAYPSKILKVIQLKYFSHEEQQRFQEQISDPKKYQLTLSSRFFIALCLLLLNLSKYFIIMVLPHQRRPIQQVLRSINTIMIDRKCFWQLYNTQQNPIDEQSILRQKTSTRDYLISGTNLPTASQIISPLSTVNLKKSQYIGQGSTVSQNKKQIIQVIMGYGQKCSNIISNGYRPIKRVSIKYTISTSQLQITDISLGRSQLYILQQLIQKQQDVIQFIVITPGQKISQQLYIKFKNQREVQNFMREIQNAQKNI